MKKSMIILLLTMVVLFSTISGSFAARFMEADETVTDFPNPLNQISIQASSPIRVGNSGSTNDWVTINGQFNNPRPGSSYVLHNGVDLQTSTGHPDIGRPAFVVYKDAKIWRKRDTISDGYGKYINIQHSFNENNKPYAFQTFYAHMYDLNTGNIGAQLLITDSVGTNGRTSTASGTPVHLHMEFRSPTTTSNTLGVNMYPPSIFYWYNGTWGNNTSFINHTSNSSTISFSINPMSLGQTYDVPASDVTLWYKSSTESMFYPTAMNKSGVNFSKSISSLGYSPPYTLNYYVQVKRYSGISEGTKYNTWRPYRYISFTDSPQDRPFTMSVNSLSASSFEASNLEITSDQIQDTGVNEYLIQGGLEKNLDLVTLSENNSKTNEALKNVNAHKQVVVMAKITDREWKVQDLNGNKKEYIMQLAFDSEYVGGLSPGIKLDIHAEQKNKNLLVIPIPDALLNMETP